MSGITKHKQILAKGTGEIKTYFLLPGVFGIGISKKYSGRSKSQGA